MSGVVELLARVCTGRSDAAWLVGGSVRDGLLGRETHDFDVTCEGDARGLARALSREAGVHVFSLSEAFGAWRVVDRAGAWQIDVTPLAGPDIQSDLALRDVTVNAMARPLAGESGLVDPFGGAGDLSAGRLKMVAGDAFQRDPLRVLRLVRLACELGFEIESETARSAREAASGLGRVAPERVFTELRLILAGAAALAGVRLLGSLGALAVVLPELEALRGVEQNHFHHLDVYEHTLAVLEQAVELDRDPARVFGVAGEAVAQVLAEPMANELTRGGALRFGALFHDMAKPQTMGHTPEGRVTFMGHDSAGAAIVREVLGARLRASEKLTEHVAALARHHLRLGFLVHQAPLSRRALYGYLKACGSVGVDVTVLSVADRLATRGQGAERAIDRHLTLARDIIEPALAWRETPPRPPLRGDHLARAIGISPGPELGRVLAELEVAEFAGEIDGPEEAVRRARALLADAAIPPRGG